MYTGFNTIKNDLVTHFDLMKCQYYLFNNISEHGH